MNRLLTQPVPWRAAARYPRKLPDLSPYLPLQYGTESEAAYRERCWRWRGWLDRERNRAQLGGPDLSCAPENEVRAWRQWVAEGSAT